jgi:hypothetical protein
LSRIPRYAALQPHSRAAATSHQDRLWRLPGVTRWVPWFAWIGAGQSTISNSAPLDYRFLALNSEPPQPPSPAHSPRTHAKIFHKPPAPVTVAGNSSPTPSTRAKQPAASPDKATPQTATFPRGPRKHQDPPHHIAVQTTAVYVFAPKPLFPSRTSPQTAKISLYADTQQFHPLHQRLT